VYVIERKFWAAAAFCLVGAGFSEVGLMHSSKLELASSPWMSIAYVALAAVMLMAQLLARASKPAPEPAMSGDAEAVGLS
jgi:hypothetical protein